MAQMLPSIAALPIGSYGISYIYPQGPLEVNFQMARMHIEVSFIQCKLLLSNYKNFFFFFFFLK